MNTTRATTNQVAAPVGNWFLNTTSITTITSSRVGSSFKTRNCFGLQLQAPLVTIAHQLLAALLVGLLAAVLARSLGNSGQTLPMSPMSSEVAHG